MSSKISHTKRKKKGNIMIEERDKARKLKGLEERVADLELTVSGLIEFCTSLAAALQKARDLEALETPTPPETPKPAA